jgi:2-dehydropantoate 2-reductase
VTSIAVVGAGAVGSYYGARLAEAGHAVTFLLRRDYDAVASGGLRVESIDGDFAIETPSIARSSDEIGPVDRVICALKATAIEAARELVAPCVGESTRVLVLMNGLGVEDRFAEWFGGHRIFGGLAFTCINRGEPGWVHHLDYGPVTLGHYLDDVDELDVAMGLWAGAHVEVSTTPSLLAARWRKLCWNIPFNGLAVTAGGITTDRITTDPELREAAIASMREVVAAGNADLEDRGEAARLDADVTVEEMMTLTDAMEAYRPSTMIDFVEGRPMEVEAIFEAPLARAQELGVPTPLMALMTAQVRALDRDRTARHG